MGQENEIAKLREELEGVKYHLDVVAGAQLAMMPALKLLISAYRGNPAAMAALEEEIERAHGLILSSHASEKKIESFEETAKAIVAEIKSKT